MKATPNLEVVMIEMTKSYRRRCSQYTTRSFILWPPLGLTRLSGRILYLALKWNEIAAAPRIKMLKGERSRDFVLSHQEEKFI
jgi:hypothetical protein